MRDLKTADKKEPWYYSVALDAVLIMAIVYAIFDIYLFADYLAVRHFPADCKNTFTTEQTIEEVEETCILLNR